MSDVKYRDKEGKPITMDDWARKIEDPFYGRVDVEQIGAYHISTVWLGLDHNFTNHLLNDGAPHIFETMVFYGVEGQDNWLIVHCARYATLKDAENGHKIIVQMVREGEIKNEG